MSITVFVLLVYAWKVETDHSWIKGFYWLMQTYTTVGYGTGFDDTWGTAEEVLCIIAMICTPFYWSVVIVQLSTFLHESLNK
jgi:hypothetical protein